MKNTLLISEKLQQKSVQEFIHSIDWNKSSNAPFVVEFDPTSNCNLACPDCISGGLLNQGEIDHARVRGIIQEFINAKIRAVILIGGGEPMMHREIGWVIEKLGLAGIKIGITTNGLYLKTHLDVTAKYASWVRVSVDAATSETFNRIRPSRTGKSLFSTVIRNMELYAKHKEGILGYSFMIYSEGNYGFKGIPIAKDRLEAFSHIKTNVTEIASAAKLAKEIGCNYFEIKPMYDVNHFSVMQKNSISDIVEEQLDLAKRLEDENFQVIEALKLRATLRGESNLEPKNYRRCAVSQLRTLITSSGAYVCPYFRGVESKKIGDINTQSLAELWHGEQRKAIMDNLDPSKDCPMHCIRNESNIVIESQLREGISKTIYDYDLFI